MKKLCILLMLCIVSIVVHGELKQIEIGFLENCGNFTKITVCPIEETYAVLFRSNDKDKNLIYINREDLGHFRETLLLIRNEYIEWKRIAEGNNIGDSEKEVPYKFSELFVMWWSPVSKQMEIGTNEFETMFAIRGEFFGMVVNGQAVSESGEKKGLQWVLCSVEDFDRLLYFTDPDYIKKALSNNGAHE